MNANSGCNTHKTQQQGIVVIMLLASLVVLLGMAGLAIDFGHAYVNKTRLQNVADALALSGAKVLNDTRSTTQADAAIATLFSKNMALAGHQELQQQLRFTDLTIGYSNHLSPFATGGAAPRYVRVTINNMQLQSWFIRVLGITTIPLSAEAIAGPSRTLSSFVCNSSPVMLCGNPAGSDSYWGYVPGTVQILKASSNQGGSCIGPGNYQLVSIGNSNSGAAEVREILAGNVEGCTDFRSGIETKPGNSAGPSIQGLNTRFGEYRGPMKSRQNDFPPDVITREASIDEDDFETDEEACMGGQALDLDFNWQAYKQRVSQGLYDHAPPLGVTERRILRVPIGDCSSEDAITGRSTIPYLGVGCFFLLKKIDNNDGNIYGEFVSECVQDGVVDRDSTQLDGPYKIVLHGALS